MVEAYIKNAESDPEIFYLLFKAFLYFLSKEVFEKMG
jgi:hypothetical protein